MKTDNNKNKGGSALKAAAIGRSATGHVKAHSGSGLANSGTNVSYEEIPASGANGLTEPNIASGKAAIAASGRIAAAQSTEGKPQKGKGKAKEADEDIEDDDLDEDFELGEDDEEFEEDEKEELK